MFFMSELLSLYPLNFCTCLCQVYPIVAEKPCFAEKPLLAIVISLRGLNSLRSLRFPLATQLQNLVFEAGVELRLGLFAIDRML